MTVMLNGTATDLITVDGANGGDVRQMLGHVDCQIVKDKRMFFFLPFDANVS
jgi:hypothetical protein